MNWKRFLAVMFALLAAMSIGSTRLVAQTTVSQGSIQGTITDATGAVVAGATVTITNNATGQVVVQTTNSSGAYNSGGLLPADYAVRVEAKGFRTIETVITVQTTVTASGNFKLEVGNVNQVIEVQASSVTVNTEQSTVQGVLTADQIDHLPIDGRNFLDLAQLEPGVQIQDGATFDPTKAGYSSISINGVFGRTPRIELDGLDISDENVGTTTQNVGLGSIEEFNISRSNLDLSTELTSAGAVNVTTRSGSNSYHGQAFYNYRNRDAGTADFAGGQDGYYERNNFGGRFGGPIIKDKLFFFLNFERQKQDADESVIVGAIPSLTGAFGSPFRDTDVVAKLDWNATKDIHVFYRWSYNWNFSTSNFGYDYSVYSNRDNSPDQAVGVDYSKGTWSHSFRFGYLKFHNLIGPASANFNPVPGTEIEFGDTGEVLSGPNLLAPQQTFQSDKQVKYDGSKVLGTHIIRFGVGVNRILGGGFASFFGLGPLAVTLTNATLGQIPGAPQPSNPLDPSTYPLLTAILGNGQGSFTEKPEFNLPGGGQSDTRLSGYVGDSWKIKPNFTLNYGLRYNRDTGRGDSDLAPIPCSATTLITCSGDLLDQFQAGFGRRVNQPNKNFGPQFGFAWSPRSDSRTVIRGGAGIYYENYIFNNTLFDRPAKLASGLFFASAGLGCPSIGSTPVFGKTSFALPGQATPVTSINGVDLATGVCLQPLSVAGPLVNALESEYQAAAQAAGPASNPSFVGNNLTFNTGVTGPGFAPDFRTARSYQMNIGFQREIVHGGVLSADYIRNVGLHFEQAVDVNHVGDARFLNATAALNAISATTTSFGCSGNDSAAIDCSIANGAKIGDFAGNGLDSGLAFSNGLGNVGSPAAKFGLTPNNFAAFPGINSNVGQGEFNEPIGRSVYSGLQMSYKQQVKNPFRGASSLDLIASYTLSKFESTGGIDQNFSPVSFDFRNPTGFFGSTGLDRRNQIKFGVNGQIAHHGPRIALTGNFGSPVPANLTLVPQSGQRTSAGDIFLTDLTGDGTVGDLFPVSNGATVGQPGQYDRTVSAGGLARAISNWNANVAGTPTPAGQALISAGLFTALQLQELGGVKPFVNTPFPGQFNNPWFKEVSAVVAWPFKIHEGISLEPSIGFYNALNNGNFVSQTGGLSATPFSIGGTAPEGGAPGSVTGTCPIASAPGICNNREPNRVGTGSGVFSQGAPRQLEFGLRLNF
jgi:hypothetical protein